LLVNYNTSKNALKKGLTLEPYTGYLVICEKNQVQFFSSSKLVKASGKIIGKI
jgi:hypothetical protein